MGERRRKNLASFELGALLLLQVLCFIAAQTTNSSTWKTLSGKKPAIIARGGFSGIFPDSSSGAYNFALMSGSPDTILYCDVQLTKDSVPICLPSIKLDNCTDIQDIYQNSSRKYELNGVETPGWFSIDFTSKQLSTVGLVQSIYSRSPSFDYSGYPILAVTDLFSQLKPLSLWLNIQYDVFYTQHKLDMRNTIITLSKSVIINHISSPEIDLLKSLSPRLPNTTSLIFRFPSESRLEPSTNQSYSSLIKNLTYIKTFADGIMVPKNYIWPVSADNYLLQHTELVSEAHQVGLEVYATDFANDNLFSYNYSYDPLAEYLGFVDNGDFSVDGVLTDFPITPSEAIGCFTNLNTSNMDHGKPLIISHNGASGDYPDCTDLAYQEAVDVGADVIDCAVQVTSDGTLICMSSINLLGITNVAQSQFSTKTSTIPLLQPTPGIFTFNLTWNDISKNLKPVISQPQSLYSLLRNPRYKNAGNFLKLSEFLAFAKDKDLDGILLTLEHVPFIMQRLGIDMITSIKTALNEAGYSNSTSLKVNILSPDSSVLTKLRSENPKYTQIYKITEIIRDASSESLTDIKKFADAVAIDKSSIYPQDQGYITNETDALARFQNAGLKVYVFGFMNEFVSQAWDFLSDATVEINTYASGAGVDAVITDFPATGRRYKRNSCYNLGKNTPNYMQPVEVGGLLQLIVAPAQPPALAPLPVLSGSDVSEPALPPVSNSIINNSNNAPGPSSHKSDGFRTVASVFVLILSVVLSLIV